MLDRFATVKNEAFGRSKDARQDEFYTQVADIEDELGHYRPHFNGKIILCNYDDPCGSNLFKRWEVFSHRRWRSPPWSLLLGGLHRR